MEHPKVEVDALGVDALFDDNGELRVGFNGITAEDMEILKTLNTSAYWKYYKELLIKAKDAYFNSTLAMSDPNLVMKNIGMVAGINFAINQLGVIVGSHANLVKRKQVEAEAKNKTVPFKRG